MSRSISCGECKHYLKSSKRCALTHAAVMKVNGCGSGVAKCDS